MTSDPHSSTPAFGLPTSQRPTNVRWIIFSLACATSFILYLHRYTWGFIKADVREEFGWSEWQLGLLDGAFSASYGLGQIPSGILCDWFGPHALLGSIIVLWSLSMGAIALATGFLSMIMARSLFGITQAGCYPTLSKVSKLWFPLSIRTSVQAWIATFFGRGGGAMSFFLFGTVLLSWLELSWREALVVFTVLGLVFGLLFSFLFRNTPKDHPWANEAETALITEGNPEVTEATKSALRWSTVLKSGNMRAFFVQQFTSAYADNVYVYWIPLFLLTVKETDVREAGWMSALPLLGGAIGGMLGGMLQNHLILRTGNRRWTRSIIGMVGKMLATVFMFVSLGFDSAVWIVSVFFVVKFFSDWSQPTVWGTITDIAGRNAASVFGCVNTVGSIAGFLAGPTMGLTIMAFSELISVPSETTRMIEVVRSKDGNTWKAVYEPLEHKNVAAGTLTGTILRGDSETLNFQVTEDGDFTFNSIGDGNVQPIAARCRLDPFRGKITIGWNSEPRQNQIVLNYDYVDYGSGWNALFIVLAFVYLVSSLAWLFIDCTKKLEADGAA